MQEQVNSLDDGADILLRARATHSGLAGGVGELPGQVQSNHQNRKLWEHCRDLLGHVHAVQIGHLVIENDEIRGRLQNLVQGLSTGPRLSTNLPALLLLKDCSQITPYCRIVIDNQNTNQPSASLLKSGFTP